MVTRVPECRLSTAGSGDRGNPDMTKPRAAAMLAALIATRLELPMPPEYRLFHSPGACSLAPHIVLEELGIAYEPVRVVIAEGANRKPEYLGINPPKAVEVGA